MENQKKIFKYPLEPSPASTQPLDLPAGAEVLHVGEQYMGIQLWAKVDPNAEPETRFFRIYGTGQTLPDDAVHLGTVQMNPFIWHVFELTKPTPAAIYPKESRV